MDKWEQARDITREVSEKLGFEKYKTKSESTPFYALYEQVIKLAEIAAHTELKIEGRSKEDASKVVEKVIKRNM